MNTPRTDAASPLSHCCLRLLKVESAGDGTSFYRCSKCGLAADPISPAGVLNRLMAMRVELGALYAAFPREPWAEEVFDAENCLDAATHWFRRTPLALRLGELGDNTVRKAKQ